MRSAAEEIVLLLGAVEFYVIFAPFVIIAFVDQWFAERRYDKNLMCGE